MVIEGFDLTTVKLTAEEERFVFRLTDTLSEIWGNFAGDLLARTQRLLEAEFGQASRSKRLEHLGLMQDAWEDGLLDNYQEPTPHKFAVFVVAYLRRPLQAAKA
ncbi:MAG TPA: hypothetical protein PKN73_02820 [Candidatus Paceibacterota bacterium]|nr:hypothetical protein [Candidatus Paceibacterota bacterium]HOH11575.1 hypothetical protein [Candidatus Paceibacterota bacterium]HOY11406.1 hypothetical protein [Candidatus Paceibacterota bacterium]HPN89716.1 hypothetical protein [Candidatus Paceibacterota bacterium]HPV33491.1 hypothetical protein [Candidatus Paceibacterota bacterium]